MDIVIVAFAALLASALTLFSGFGLGTLLMPVVAIFFSVEVAIVITAIVHLANNLFKVILLGARANRSVVLRFGIPAVIFSFLGALALLWLSNTPALFSYNAFGQQLQVQLLKLVVGILILMFVALELSPGFASLSIDKKYLPCGGVISGFFGGLSGHQGAFRSMFLIKSGLSKEQYIATGVVLAVLVDVSRMLIYGWDLSTANYSAVGCSGADCALDWTLIIVACLAAFAGAYFGAKLVKKVTIRSIQLLVSATLTLVSLGLISGLI